MVEVASDNMVPGYSDGEIVLDTVQLSGTSRSGNDDMEVFGDDEVDGGMITWEIERTVRPAPRTPWWILMPMGSR